MDVHLTHPCVEFCRNSFPCYTTYLCQPILNQRSKDRPQNLRSQDFHLTHPCFEFCQNSSMLPHACVPTHPEPTSEDTPQTTHDSVLQAHPHPSSQIHLPKFQCSPNRQQKRLHFEPAGSLARRLRPIKTWLRPSLQKWLSASFHSLNYLRPTCCKHVLKRCSLG